MIDALIAAFLEIAQPAVLIYLLAGVALGLTLGVLPGLGGTAGLAILLPFVYGMDPASGIALMIGVTAVVATADTFPAVLIGVPGSVSGQATVVDGFPLAKAGHAGHALSSAFVASLVGGVLGAALLTITVFFAEPIILSFGAGEMLMLALLGISMVGILTGTSWLKGLTAAGLGMAFGAIGIAPASSEYRLDFAMLYLSNGIPLIVLALAAFAVPEISDLLRRDESISQTHTLISNRLSGFIEVWRHRWLVVRSSLLGAAVGMLPGLGGAVVDWIAYAQAVQTARDKSRFGKGDIRGVIAPESANNAKEGGALVPTLIFGIPGSAATAILIGGLILLGVDPGPTMIARNLDTVYVIIWSLAIANIFGACACLLLTPTIAKLTTVRFAVIAPFMIALVYFAAFQASHSWGDLVGLLTIGSLAIFMRRFGYSRAAFMIGFVLAGSIETNFYLTSEFYGWQVFQRPLFLCLMLLTAISVFFGVQINRRQRRDADRPQYPVTPAQWIFLFLLVATAVALILLTNSLTWSGRMFPTAISVLLLTTLILLGCTLLLAKPGSADVMDLEFERNGETRSMAMSLGLLSAPLLLSLLVGFWLAAGAFVALFLRFIARTSWIQAATGATLAYTALYALGYFLNMRFPQGLLTVISNYVFPF